MFTNSRLSPVHHSKSEAPAPLILELQVVDETRHGLVGGKVANLVRLMGAGMPVPGGFCVTTVAFEEFLNSWSERERVSELISKCSTGEVEQIGEFSREIQGCMAKSVVPAAVKEAVLAAWRKLGVGGNYAVRSSATVEDGAERSFAGQFESKLNVRGAEAMVEAVKECWASVFSERSLVYLARQKVPFEKVRMAVLVQEMVAADFSGVLFTAEPLSGATDRLVVEWVPGLGEELVQGTREPRRMVIEKTSRRVLELKDGDLMSEEVRQHLLKLALEAERLFGAPQDIEWAVRNGEVWLLQARPITTLVRKPLGATVVEVSNAERLVRGGEFGRADRLKAVLQTGGEVWSNLNIVENLPEVATPLTWSLMDLFAHKYMRPILEGMGADPTTDPWVGLIAGRVYMNVRTALKILRCLPGFRPEHLTWLLGGHQEELVESMMRQANAAKPSLKGRILAAFRLMRLGAGFVWMARFSSSRKCLALLTAWVDEFGQCEPKQKSMDEIFARLNTLQPDLIRRIRMPIRIGVGFACHGLFRGGCQKWFQDAHGTLANRLISRAGGMASAEPAMALWRMAAFASERAELKGKLQAAGSFAAVAEALPAIPGGKEFLEQWNEFMRRHGHHASGELEIATPRWGERPDEVLRLLQGYLNGAEKCDPSRILAERAQEREKLLQECEAKLRGPFKRSWLHFLIRETQAWIQLRENAKSEIVRGLGICRRFVLELGERLVKSGVIECRDDIFFLTCEELEPVCRGTAGFDVRAVICERREEFERNRAISPPTVVVGQFEPSEESVAPIGEAGKELRGLAVSAGVVTGQARVMLRADEKERILPGEILVAPFTDPGWTLHFLTAGGLVTDIGGQLSHGSVVAREYGLPAVVNVRQATSIIKTGDLLRVDGDKGKVTILGRGATD